MLDCDSEEYGRTGGWLQREVELEWVKVAPEDASADSSGIVRGGVEYEFFFSLYFGSFSYPWAPACAQFL